MDDGGHLAITDNRGVAAGMLWKLSISLLCLRRCVTNDAFDGLLARLEHLVSVMSRYDI